MRSPLSKSAAEELAGFMDMFLPFHLAVAKEEKEARAEATAHVPPRGTVEPIPQTEYIPRMKHPGENPPGRYCFALH